MRRGPVEGGDLPSTRRAGCELALSHVLASRPRRRPARAARPPPPDPARARRARPPGQARRAVEGTARSATSPPTSARSCCGWCASSSRASSAGATPPASAALCGASAEPVALKRVIPCLDVDARAGRQGHELRRPARRGRSGRARRALRRRGRRRARLPRHHRLARAARHDRRARAPDRRQRLHPVHDRRRHPLGRRRPGGARRRRRQGLGQLVGARAPGADRRAGRGLRLPVRRSIAIDAKRLQAPGSASRWDVYVNGGRTLVEGREAVAWAREAAERGAGEILLTSMDRDGTTDGYDLALTRAVADAVAVPVIASGGAGELEHLVEGDHRGRRRRGPRRLDLPLRQVHASPRRSRRWRGRDPVRAARRRSCATASTAAIATRVCTPLALGPPDVRASGPSRFALVVLAFSALRRSCARRCAALLPRRLALRRSLRLLPLRPPSSLCSKARIRWSRR